MTQDMPEWQAGTAIDPKSFAEARTQAQNAVHWLARLAHSYREAEPGMGHLALSFDAGRQAIVTQPLAGGVTVELRLPALELQFREADRPVPHVLDVEGRSPAEVEAWVLVELLHRGIDRDRFSTSLPYEPVNLMTGDNVEYSPEACAHELAQLARWFRNAGAVLGRLGAPRLSSSGPGPLMCWPEPFHVGIVVATEPGSALGDTALRVALSAGDARHAEPYFFVAKQQNGVVETPHPGAVLTASRIAAEDMSCEQVAEVLRAAITTAQRRLAH